jgi:hypothetical protein
MDGVVNTQRIFFLKNLLKLDGGWRQIGVSVIIYHPTAPIVQADQIFPT